MATSFCHLHTHTQYSLLDGACRIKQTAEIAAEMGMTHVAMTDHGNMFGAVEFYEKMSEAGIKPIIGYEGYLTLGDRRDRTYTGARQDLYHLTLLARDQTGYQNLLKISSLAYMEGFYYKPRMDWELLSENSAGLICLSGCLTSRLNKLILADQLAEAEQWLGRMRDLFGEDAFYVELQDHGLPEQRKALPEAIRLARKLAIPTVATNDAHYLHAEDQSWHDVLLCINTRKTLDDPDRFRLKSDQLYFKSPQEMAAVFPDEPEAIANTVAIAQMCDVKLDDSLKYPSFHQEGVEDNAAFLRELSEQGLKERYGKLSSEMQERLDYELGVIEQMGYVDYFLVVRDFVCFARDKAIPVGMRGSGCGSLAGHAMGLSDINPMDYDLIFSRFLDPERLESPDIDIDLCENRRSEVMEYVREQYGRESTAQIIAFGTLAPRGAIRDVGRVLGVPLATVDRAAKMFPFGPKMTFEKGMKSASELKAFAEKDKDVARILSYARHIEGIPRNATTHAAGMVIADKPLYELIPLYKSGDDGDLTTQWAKDDLEHMGMLKMDFLGVNTLTIIDRALRLIEERGHEPPSLDAASLDLHDKATYELLVAGNTSGVFQFSSDGMKRLLRKAQPSSMEDLIAIVALYRPGPLKGGMVDDFVERRHGRAKTEYPHPAFEPILKPTHGLIVYQEQIMRIINEIAGVSLAQALTVIKAIGKKNDAVINAGHRDFVDGATARGVGEKTAEDIFGLIKHFGGYGFNKAHAAAYAFVAFRTAYLKAHFPTEFMAAGISCEMGNTDKVVELMEDCAQLGVQILPPDVNHSGADFRVVEDGVIRFGMGAVKNVGMKAVESAIAERDANGAFASIFDFSERVDPHEVNRAAVEALLKAGCFDELPGSRAQQLAVLDAALKAGAKIRKNRDMGQVSLFADSAEVQDPVERAKLNLPNVPPFSPRELARQEHDALGVYVRHDPLQEHRARLRRLTSTTSDEIGSLPDGEPVLVGGLVEAVTKRRTRDGRPLAVLKVLDLKGYVECVLFAETYDKYIETVESDEVLLFGGSVSQRQNAGVRVSEILNAQEAARKLVTSVCIRVDCATAHAGLWRDIKAVLGRHGGQLPVTFDLESEGMMLRCAATNGHKVEASESLALEVEELLGPGAVRFGVGVDAMREKRPAGSGGRGRRRT